MRRVVLQRCLAGLLSFAACAQAASGEEARPADESAELAGLLAVLEQQTEIATRTRMNADYVPGLVTVLHGDELEGLGVRTVWEALRLVPGVEPSADQIGGRQTLVRGVGGAFASGNMKILLDGRSMNSALSANANPVLNMPIEQVSRIEVIRGPGSAIHGEFAYAGVINVITRKDADGVFVRAGRFDTYGAGGFRHWRSEDGRSGGSVSLGGWHSRGARVSSGPDALFSVPAAGIPANPLLNGALSNAPGPVNDEMEQRSLLLDLYRDEYALSATYIEDGNGDHFGTINVLSRPDDGIAYRNRYLMLDGKGGWRLSDVLATELRLGWQYYENRFDIRLLPDGFFWFNRLAQLRPLPNGYLSEGYYDEQRMSAEFDVHWDGWRDHDWLFGVGATHIEVGDAWEKNNVDPITLDPLPTRRRMTSEDGVEWVPGDRKRRILSLTVQDEYRATEDVTLTAGLRYDDYDDFGGKLSPRLAAVWRFGRRHVLKAQYAEAFRPPTFYEMVWDEDLSPATIRTTELAYIFKTPATEARLTAFRSRLDDQIVGSGILGFTNADAARTVGAEIELDQRLTGELRLKANVTLADTEQVDTGERVPGAADRLANVALVFQPTSRQTYGLWLRHVGERAREAGDARDRLSGYETVDVAASFNNVGMRGLTLRLGVSNLFDERIRYPAPLTLDVIGQAIPSYAGDYPQPGRAGWVQLSYRM